MEKNKVRIIFSSTGPSYSFDIAKAFQEFDVLKKFYTTKPGFLYSRPHFNLLVRLSNLLPLGSVNKSKILTWANYKFDSYVANCLKKDEYDIFYGMQGASINSLRQAKKQDKMVFIEQHDCYYKKVIQLVSEEIQINPDFISTFGSYWPFYQPYLDLFRQETFQADYIVTLSSYSFNSFIEAGVSPGKIIKIPLGVDTEKFKDIRHTKDDKIFRIVFIGAIGQRKGIKYLLEAVKSLNRKDIKILLLGNIIGSKTPFKKYRDFIEHPGFVGHREFKKYLSMSDIFCLPSINDSFGQVILEAMASGLPVIVSQNTAAHDVVREGIDGFVVPIRDINALKEKIMFFYENRQKITEMSVNARSRAKEFDLDIYKTRLVNEIMQRYNSYSGSRKYE